MSHPSTSSSSSSSSSSEPSVPCPYVILGCDVMSSSTSLPSHLISAAYTHLELWQHRYEHITSMMKNQRLAMMNAQTRCREISMENERLRQELARYQGLAEELERKEEKQDASWITSFPNSPSPSSSSLVHISRDTITPLAPQASSQPSSHPHHLMSASVPIPSRSSSSLPPIPIPISASAPIPTRSLLPLLTDEDEHPSYVHVDEHDTTSLTSSMASLPTGSAPLTPVSARATPTLSDMNSSPSSADTIPATASAPTSATVTSTPPSSIPSSSLPRNDPLSLTSLLHLLEHIRIRIIATITQYITTLPNMTFEYDAQFIAVMKQREICEKRWKQMEWKQHQTWDTRDHHENHQDYQEMLDDIPSSTDISDHISNLTTFMSLTSSIDDDPVNITRCITPKQIICIQEEEKSWGRKLHLDALCPAVWLDHICASNVQDKNQPS